MNQQIGGGKQEVPVAAVGLAAGTPVAGHSLPAGLGSLAAAGRMLTAESSCSGCS